MNKHEISNFVFEDVHMWDYPDFCDAHIVSAELNGEQMTEEQIEELNEDDDLKYELLMQYLY
jgi:hypothetical protein